MMMVKNAIVEVEITGNDTVLAVFPTGLFTKRPMVSATLIGEGVGPYVGTVSESHAEVGFWVPEPGQVVRTVLVYAEEVE